MEVLKIEKEIMDLIQSTFQKNVKDSTDELLSNEVGLSPVDLAILFSTLENKYHIQFETEDILNYQFNNVQNIAVLVLAAQQSI
ncbi:MAG: hypothetical protein H6Q70_1274 [Firmicutes bacterium]|nr:hypothetical protein [Bacillota bacterium]